MMRSLYTGISGLRSQQVRMDIIGNNIANVNTVAFKRSRAAFQEVFGQQMIGVSRLSGGNGINPAVVGQGVSVGSIDQNWAQGAFTYTNLATDLSLDGDGFFVVNGGEGNMLTRAGNFMFDGEGRLVTAGGLNVQGWSYDRDGNVDTGTLRDVQIDPEMTGPPRFSENALSGGNLSADAEVGDVSPMTAVVYDEQGRTHTALITFTKTAENEWSYDVAYQGDATPPPFAAASGSMTFNTEGRMDTPPEISLDWDPNYVTSGSFKIDVSSLTQYSGSTTISIHSQDGYGAGEMMGYSFDAEGTLYLNFSNGQREAAFQLAVGDVNNPNGLEQLGQNLYGVTAAAGELVVGRAGSEVSANVVSGALEMGNVDLATEFTDMIVTQRGYQASARVITTSDELLQELVQLKR